MASTLREALESIAATRRRCAVLLPHVADLLLDPPREQRTCAICAAAIGNDSTRCRECWRRPLDGKEVRTPIRRRPKESTHHPCARCAKPCKRKSMRCDPCSRIVRAEQRARGKQPCADCDRLCTPPRRRCSSCAMRARALANGTALCPREPST